MKRILTLLALACASASAVWAEPPAPESQPLIVTNSTPSAVLSTPVPGYQVNEIRRRRTVYSGSVVQAVKPHRAFELINPFAPATAGSGTQNTVLDPITGKPAGLKLLAISF